jgi:hypothetical protein
MHSLVALIPALSLVALVLSLVARFALPQLRRGLARLDSRLRALWAWRNGRERAVMRGVIRC